MAAGVGLEDLQRVRLQQQDRLVGGIEQQPVAGLDVAQLPVFLFHRLLGGDQAGLEFRDGVEVAPDREQPGLAAQPDRRVLHRELEAAGKALGDLAERGDAFFARVLDHAHDLAAGDIADGFHPTPAEPVIDRFVGDGVGQGHVPDDPIHVQHEGDIRLGDGDIGHEGCGDCNLLETHTGCITRSKSLQSVRP